MLGRARWKLLLFTSCLTAGAVAQPHSDYAWLLPGERLQPGQLLPADGPAIRREDSDGSLGKAQEPAGSLSEPQPLGSCSAGQPGPGAPAATGTNGGDQHPEPAKFNWRGALLQSGLFLLIEHSYRFADQPYTREALKGPWLKDYWLSIKGLHGWGDTDDWLANYVGHPMQGAVSGFIQIQNDPEGRRQRFGKSHEYWKSRLKALGWAAAYSTQYELGPLGEAAWGNVGHIYERPGTKGYVDLVITPTLGFSLLLIEDLIDRYIIWPGEQRIHNVMAKRLLRAGLNLHRAFANLLRFQVPWRRDDRPPVTYPAARFRQAQAPPAEPNNHEETGKNSAAPR